MEDDDDTATPFLLGIAAVGFGAILVALSGAVGAGAIVKALVTSEERK